MKSLFKNTKTMKKGTPIPDETRRFVIERVTHSAWIAINTENTKTIANRLFYIFNKF